MDTIRLCLKCSTEGEVIDQYQYDSGTGPCVDAVKTGEAQYFNTDEVQRSWRQFAEVAADAGIYSVVSFPLRLQDSTMGALNFYSHKRDALRSGQLEEGYMFAMQAAATVANAKALAERGEEVAQLHAGLETRVLIGQATGLMMAQEGISSEEAFHKLATLSQNSNQRLRDIAQRLVNEWEASRKSPS